jgi:hypothetical protein
VRVLHGLQVQVVLVGRQSQSLLHDEKQRLLLDGKML